MLEQNPKESCGAKRRNSLLGLYVVQSSTHYWFWNGWTFWIKVCDRAIIVVKSSSAIASGENKWLEMPTAIAPAARNWSAFWIVIPPVGINGISRNTGCKHFRYSTPPNTLMGKTLTAAAPACKAVIISVGVSAPAITGILLSTPLAISSGLVWGVKRKLQPQPIALSTLSISKTVPVPILQSGNSCCNLGISYSARSVFQAISISLIPPAAAARAISRAVTTLSARITAIMRCCCNKLIQGFTGFVQKVAFAFNSQRSLHKAQFLQTQ